MKKIISLLKRDYAGTRLVYDEVVPGAEWVQDGEGIATQKLDGTCCRVLDGTLWKRYTIKRGKKAPEDFSPATDINPQTGKQEGWVPVGDGPEDKHHRAAFERGPLSSCGTFCDGTYELIGPKIQGNPEGFRDACLIQHGAIVLAATPPRTFDELKSWLREKDIEGIVWHHPDGRMVKIKKKDFGLPRTPDNLEES